MYGPTGVGFLWGKSEILEVPPIFMFLLFLQEATRNKCIASSNKCLTSSNKKLLGTSASLLVTSALLVVTRSY